MREEDKLHWHFPRGKQDDAGRDDSSCILFHGIESGGTIIAGHIQDPRVKIGDSFWELAKLTPSRIAMLKEALQECRAVWLFSDLGVGVLMAHFYWWTECLVYFHIHEAPERVKYWVRSGCFGQAIGACPYGERTIRCPDVDETYDAAYIRTSRRIAYINEVAHQFISYEEFQQRPCAEVYKTYIQFANVTGCKLSLASKCQSGWGNFMDKKGYDDMFMRFLSLFWLYALKSLSPMGEVELSFERNWMDIPLCIGLKCCGVSKESLQNRENLNAILEQMEFVVSLGEKYEVLTTSGWEDGQMKVKIHKLNCPLIYRKGDFKAGLGFGRE